MEQANEDVKPRVWPIVLALAHVVFVLSNVWAALMAAERRVSAPAPLWGYSKGRVVVIQLMETYELLGRLFFVAMGIYMITLLLRRDKRVPQYSVRYGVLFLFFEATVHSQYFFWGAPLSSFMTEWSRSGLFAGLIISWLVFASRSSRIRATFDRETAIGASPWMIWLGVALATWPFVTNLFVDTTTLLSGILSPRAVSEGWYPAMAVMTVSVASGLFILMGPVGRMKVAWITVLLPLSLVVLGFTYVMCQMLHFTF